MGVRIQWVGLVVGLCGVGCLDSEVQECPAPAPPSAAELASLCDSGPSESKALALQDEVGTLQGELARKELVLKELEAEARNDETRARATKAQQDELKKDIASLRGKLTQTEAMRDEARAELVKTLKVLDKQIAETAKVQAEADTQRARANQGEWSAFVAQAKVEVCDKGTRKRHERCHATVEGALGPKLGERFQACVDSGQAQPELRALDKAGTLPQHGVKLKMDDRAVRGDWAVVFCDPRLPENTDQ